MGKNEGPVVCSRNGQYPVRMRNPRVTQRVLQRCIKNVEWTTTSTTAAVQAEHSSTETPASHPLNPLAPPFFPSSVSLLVAETSATLVVDEVSSSPSSAGVLAPPPPVNVPSLRFDVGAQMIPHPAKAHKGGEDAYFVCSDASVLGIADGVGGWEALGVDSGLYSRSLMAFCGEAVDSAAIRNPIQVLQYAHGRCSCLQGSTTACVISLNSADSSLSAVNLGDSGFMIIREGRLYYKTKEQQHFFNCPYQIGSSRDQPEDAERLHIENIQVGDVVIACTDGVFDNLFPDDIVRIIVESLHLGPQWMAKRVADAASEVARNGEAYTPFQDGAFKAGQLWKGGKLDDITVIVAIVSKAESSS